MPDPVDERPVSGPAALQERVGGLAVAEVRVALGKHQVREHQCGVWVTHGGLSLASSRVILAYISTLVNIDACRYDGAMPRAATTLVDPDVQLLQALAHPTRLAILRELSGTSEVCACDFTSCCDVRQPTVSHHLKILKEAGVIEADRRGTWIYYRLVPAAAERLRAIAGELLGTGQVIPAGTIARRGRGPARGDTSAAPA